tara:strand:- start:1069 stop:1905 length:837 start_codon:yes stop_codon:yes gene_type:complete
MSKIYEVWSIARSDGKPHSWGARKTRDEAEILLGERSTGEHEEWAQKHHSRWWIEEIDTTGLFEIPSKPAPRDRFTADTTQVESRPGTWNTLRVDIRDEDSTVVAQYTRNYPSLMQTFEPFRQGDRLFALISKDYTCSSVLDLQTGEVIASEEPSSGGFCPVGFYVPDWWDIHDGSVLPGSKHWSDDYELPKGDFGFVWGCVWGDDSSWKVQYLDLSTVQQGQLARDDRFGYVKLAARSELAAREFIGCQFYGGKASVRFDVEQEFDLSTGEAIDDME